MKLMIGPQQFGCKRAVWQSSNL